MCSCVCVCCFVSGVFVYVCDCGVCGLRLWLCVVCEDCVMVYGMLLEWCVCFLINVYVCVCV